MRSFAFGSLRRHSSAQVLAAPTARRFQSTATPGEPEVLVAFKVLGIAGTNDLSAVRQRYVNLAKEHHPDVKGGGSASTTAHQGSSRMTEINSAYETIKTFLKAGRKLSTPGGGSYTHTSSGGGRGHSSQQRHSQQQHQQPFTPWHEDFDPLLYEMMWEEMRRQNEEDAQRFGGRQQQQHPFGRKPSWNSNNSNTGNRKHSSNNNNNSSGNHRRKNSAANNGNNRQRSGDDGQQQQRAKSTTTWPEAELKAMVNMYQDGKSFDFIANALGKQTADVTLEFNRWSEDTQRRQQHHGRRHRRPRRGRQPPQQPLYYHMQSPDDFPFHLYDAGDLEEDPYGYGDYMGDDDADGDFEYGDGPFPFSGDHSMSGGSGGHFHRPNSNRW